MKKNQVRFTVAICSYNIEKYIERAIESVLKQNFDNYEIIIVDDCSKDDTLNIIKKYENYEKVRFFKNPSNTGTAGAGRNIAIENAKGEYIIFLDGDDTLYDNMVLKKVDEDLDEEIDILYVGFEDVGQGNKERISTQENSSKIARILCDLTFSVSSRCWNTDFLRRNNMKFIEGMYYEDEVFSLKATILSTKTKSSDIKIFKYYRNRQGSVMSAPSVKKCSDWYRMLAEVMDLYNIVSDEYKPYLLSFIKNENESIPKRIAEILIALENNTGIKLYPKREYKFRSFFESEN